MLLLIAFIILLCCWRWVLLIVGTAVIVVADLAPILLTLGAIGVVGWTVLHAL